MVCFSDYQALSLTNESHAFILTSCLNGWCPRFLLVLLLLLWFLFIYLFNNLATEVTVRTRKTY